MSCLRLQLALTVNVLQVQADVLLGGLEKLRHLLLRKPDGFILQSNVNFHLPVFGAIDEKLAFRRQIRFFGSAHFQSQFCQIILAPVNQLQKRNPPDDWPQRTAPPKL